MAAWICRARFRALWIAWVLLDWSNRVSGLLLNCWPAARICSRVWMNRLTASPGWNCTPRMKLNRSLPPALTCSHLR